MKEMIVLKKELLDFLEANNNFGLEQPQEIVDSYISIYKDQKEMTFQLEAQLLINRFYELETDGKKMDYDTAVECAKITAETIIESGGLYLPEDRLYWKCVKKQCDLLHSQEYLMASLKRDEKIYSHADESGSQGTQGVDGISDEGLKNAVESKEVHSIVPYIIESQKSPTEIGMYICRMQDAYIKMCHWDGEMWKDAWKATLTGKVKNWMKIPTQL